MLRHNLLRISSKDRDSKADSTSDFTVHVNNSATLQQIRSVVVKQASIPYTFYNVTSDNNTFTYKIGGVASSFTIPEGQYNSASLIGALVTSGAAIVFGVTQSASTFAFTMTSTTAIQYLDISLNPMAEILGILYGQGSVGDVLTYTATGLPDLSGHANVYIESESLGRGNLLRTNGVMNNTLVVVPMTVPFGFIEQYVTSHSDIDDVDNDEIGGSSSQKIDIKLTDVNGNVLNLHGHHISLIIKIYY